MERNPVRRREIEATIGRRYVAGRRPGIVVRAAGEPAGHAPCCRWRRRLRGRDREDPGGLAVPEADVLLTVDACCVAAKRGALTRERELGATQRLVARVAPRRGR